jgi:hypothetical protein
MRIRVAIIAQKRALAEVHIIHDRANYARTGF